MSQARQSAMAVAAALATAVAALGVGPAGATAVSAERAQGPDVIRLPNGFSTEGVASAPSGLLRHQPGRARGVDRQPAYRHEPGAGGAARHVAAGRLYAVRGLDNNRVAVLHVRRVEGSFVATFQRSVGDPDLSLPSTATRDFGDLWAVNAEFGTGDNTYEVVRIELG